MNECELGLCNEPDSWCINLRGSFACCTSNSTSSDCIGLEITGGQGSDLHIINAGTIWGRHLPSSKVAKTTGSEEDTAFGKVETDRKALVTKGVSSNGGQGSWSSGSRGTNISSSGRKGGWAIETVGEWKNFTGHAIIIGRGRIENGKWNVTRGSDGKLIGIGMAKSVNNLHPSLLFPEITFFVCIFHVVDLIQDAVCQCADAVPWFYNCRALWNV